MNLRSASPDSRDFWMESASRAGIRLRRHSVWARWRTRSSSVTPLGRRKDLVEKSPCLRAFWEERCLPSSVRGPGDWWSDSVIIPRMEGGAVGLPDSTMAGEGGCFGGGILYVIEGWGDIVAKGA